MSRTLQQPDNEDETETEKVLNIRPETLKHFIHKNNKVNIIVLSCYLSFRQEILVCNTFYIQDN